LDLQGKYAEAQAQFPEVIRYRPDFAPAHLYLGITLAKQGKTDPALLEFQKTLQLDPGNKLAPPQIAALQAAANSRSIRSPHFP
jgi:tetratricopeptide (TPR) repeat protein